MSAPPSTDQEIEDWLNANRDYFDPATWDEQTCVISTSLNAGTEPEMEWGVADYKAAKQIAAAAKKALSEVSLEATRDWDTGLVEVRVTGSA